MTDQRPETCTGSIPPGTKIGHYVIESFIGAGGMGEVYRARDDRLGREVAFKVLPAEYGENHERVRRFELEARATGSLSHPNIVSIFDTGNYEGRPWLVAELLEGTTLRTYLDRSGRLSVRKVVDLAVQMAHGLAAAHDKGVIHRDLKPANIFVSGDGQLKILDFGLAKLVKPDWTRSDADPDTISALSVPGKVLGSVGYMSPEQMEARPVDARSDIFSLGAILYELLVGTRAFSGNSAAGTVSAVLRDDPLSPLEARPDTPRGLAAIILRCLDKTPDGRFQSARDLSFALEELLLLDGEKPARFSPILRPLRRLRSRPKITIALATALLATVALATIRRGDVQPAEPVIERITTHGAAAYPAVTADGKYVAYRHMAEGWQSSVRVLQVATGSELELVPAADRSLTGVEVSPTGDYVYFTRARFTRGEIEAGRPMARDLVRVPLLGGETEVVVQDVSGGTPAVAPDGQRIAFLREKDAVSSIWVSPVDGKQPEEIFKGSGIIFSLSWAPDGASLVFLSFANLSAEPRCMTVNLASRTAADVWACRELRPVAGIKWISDAGGLGILRVDQRMGGELWVVDDSGERRRIIRTNQEYAGVSSGAGTLILKERWVQANLWKWQPGAGGRQLTSGTMNRDGRYGIAVANDGAVYYASSSSGRSQLFKLAGAIPTRLTRERNVNEDDVAVSPDSRSIAFVRSDNEKKSRAIWVANADGTDARKLTTGADESNPQFSADGREVLYVSSSDSKPQVFAVAREGGLARAVPDAHCHEFELSPGGQSLLCKVEHAGFGFMGRWVIMDLERGNPPVEVDMHPVWYPRWAPDGKGLTVIARREGADNIWYRPLDGGPDQKISDFPAGSPGLQTYAWAPDGEFLVASRYRGNSDLMLVRNFEERKRRWPF